MRLWWDEITVTGPEGDEIPFDEFTAAGVRWWDGLHAGDPRTEGHGIYVLAPRGKRRRLSAIAGLWSRLTSGARPPSQE